MEFPLHLSIHARLFSVLLFYLFIFMPIMKCLDYCSLMVRLEVKLYKSPLFFFQSCLNSSGFFAFLCGFQNLTVSPKVTYWNFEWNNTECTGHWRRIDILTTLISPTMNIIYFFILGSSSVSLSSFVVFSMHVFHTFF